MRRALLVLVATASAAHADVDWARGLVVADGIGVANRAAPTPAAARGPARRLAEEAAKKQLAAQLGALPIADGGTVKSKLKQDALDRVVANALVVAADPETDGSWKVTMGVPIEALRIALVGARALAAGGDDAVPVVIVEGANAKPAIGYTVGGLAAATLFVKDVPAWVEKAAPRVKAKSAKAGVIDVTPPAKASDATLFVVLTK